MGREFDSRPFDNKKGRAAVHRTARGYPLRLANSLDVKPEIIKAELFAGGVNVLFHEEDHSPESTTVKKKKFEAEFQAESEQDRNVHFIAGHVDTQLQSPP